MVETEAKPRPRTSTGRGRGGAEAETSTGSSPVLARPGPARPGLGPPDLVPASASGLGLESVLISVNRELVLAGARIHVPAQPGYTPCHCRGLPLVGCLDMYWVRPEMSPALAPNINVSGQWRPKAEAGRVPLPWREGYPTALPLADSVAAGADGVYPEGVPGQGTPGPRTSVYRPRYSVLGPRLGPRLVPRPRPVPGLGLGPRLGPRLGPLPPILKSQITSK